MKARFGKTLVYAAATLIFLLVAVVYQSGMYKIDQIDVSYFQAQRFLLVAGAVALGSGFTVRRSAKADAWVLSLLGVGLIAVFVTMFLMLGGMAGPFDEAGYTAANVQLIVIHAAALVCFVRGAVLAFGASEMTARMRNTSRIVCAALAILMVCLLITGYGTRFARYDEVAVNGYGYSEV